MKTILHNFLSLFRRYTAATVLNVIGLSVAFTAFIVLMMQVSYDWGYDNFHNDADRLYRVELVNSDDAVAWSVLPRPFIDAFIASSPHIETGTLIYYGWESQRNVAVEQNGERIGFMEPYVTVYPNFTDVFDFHMIEGDRSALTSPDKVLIPESMARRLFPDSPATGQFFIGNELKAEIGGVYRDFPANSSIQNAIYRKIPDQEGAGEWSYNNYTCFIRLDNPANASQVIQSFEANLKHEQINWKKQHLRLTTLPDMYYLKDIIFDKDEKANPTQMFVFLCIAILIISIAAINFTNFSNSLVPMRLKNINTQKVLGCSQKTLRMSIVIEAVAICLLSFGLSIFFVYLLGTTYVGNMVNGGITIQSHLPLILKTSAFAVLVGLLAGCWPAFYITSFQPALVLKGNFGLSPKGRNLRNVLVGLQFMVSFALIIGAVFVSLQNRFMTHASLGFDKDQVAIITLNKKLQGNTRLVCQQLEDITGVEAAATSGWIVGGQDELTTNVFKYQGEEFFCRQIIADPAILRVMGIRVTEGRDFFPEDALSQEGVYIFNETARKAHNLELGSNSIVGFIDDVKYNSFRNEVEPFCFVCDARSYFRQYALIRIQAGTNYATLVKSVNDKLKAIAPDYPLEISLYDTVLENLYQKEITLGRQISFFSLIAILISLIGVFGVVMFESQYKRKEIGIRKVFGSTVREILALLNRHYIRILVASFVVAAPVVYYMLGNWLQHFAYKTPMYWWVFALAFLIVTTITLAIVSIQNWRAAMANPVESIKAE